MGRHRPRTRDSRKHIDWINKAGEDITAAKILMNHPQCFNACAFHCQQAIEKSLKAYILVASDMLVDGHNLTWLCRQANKYDREKAFSQWLEDSAGLNKFYIETRYPTDLGVKITGKNIERIYKTAREMYDFICSQIYEEQEEELDDFLANIESEQ